MFRVFLGLAGANVALFVVTAGVGLIDTARTPDRHVLLAVLSLLFACFLQVLTFTYAVVSGKMIAQMVHLGKLDAAPLEQVRRLKRNLARLVAVQMSSVVLVVATGAVRWRGDGLADVHLATAGLAVLVHLSVLYRECTLVTQTSALLRDSANAYARSPRRQGARAEFVP